MEEDVVKRFLRGVILSLIGLLVISLPVWAISNPDSISIGDGYVFRNVLEAGDALVFMRYDVSYNITPTEDAEDAFLMVVYDIDGTTIIATRPLNYYQHNIISVYLTPAQNTLTWGGAHRVRVTGSPSIFSPLVEGTNMRTKVLSGGDYKEAVDLGGTMITQAGILQTDWETSLLTSGNLLNTTGSNYFIKAVPGLSSMAPEIFSATSAGIPWSRVSHNTTGANATAEHLPTSLDEALTGLNELFGITDNNFGSVAWIVFFGMIVGGVIFSATKRPDVAALGGFGGVLGISTYLGVAEPNVMLLLLTIVGIIGILFVVEYILPRIG